MMASACHDGSVRIWSTNLPERASGRGKKQGHATVFNNPDGSERDIEAFSFPTPFPRRPDDAAGGMLQTSEPTTAMHRPTTERYVEEAGLEFADSQDGKEGRT